MDELQQFGAPDIADTDPRECGTCAFWFSDGFSSCGICQHAVKRSMDAGRDIRSCRDICEAARDALVDEGAIACDNWKSCENDG